MDLGLFCDCCTQNFNTSQKVPMIILCGHTVCKECAQDVQRNSFCKICQKPQIIEDFTSLKVNQKLFAVLNLQINQRIQPSQQIQNQNQVQQQQQQPGQRPLYSFQSGHITNLAPKQQQQQLQQNLQNLNNVDNNFYFTNDSNNSAIARINSEDQNQIQHSEQIQQQQFKPLGMNANIIPKSQGTQSTDQHSEVQNISILNDEQLQQTPSQLRSNDKNDSQYQSPNNNNNNQQNNSNQQLRQDNQDEINQNAQHERISPQSFIKTPLRLISLDDQNDNQPIQYSQQNSSGQPQHQNFQGISTQQQQQQLQQQLQQVQNQQQQQQQQQVIVQTPKSNQLRAQRQLCKIHFDRVIEYFCQQCNISVCSKCMFLHHNGHDLKQLEDALNIMKAKLQQFDITISDTMRDNSETQQVLINNKQQVQDMRDKQLEIIEFRFKELLNKIEERKQHLSREILHKYDSNIFKINDKIKMIEEQYEDLIKAKQYYTDTYTLLQDQNFIKSEGSDRQILLLEKVPEYDKFVYENTLKIKAIQVAQKNTKNEYQEGLQIGLNPIKLTLNNSISLIQTLQFDNYQNDLQQMSFIGQLPPKDNSMSRQQLRISQQNSNNGSQTNIITNIKMSNNQQLESSFTYPKGSRAGTPSHQSSYTFQNIQIPPLNYNPSLLQHQQPQQQDLLRNNKFQHHNQQISIDNNYQNFNPNNHQVQMTPSSSSHSNNHKIHSQFNQLQNSPQKVQMLNTQLEQIQQQQVPLTQQQIQQQFANMNSKFAKLKFSRQQTNNSQELTLQLDTPAQSIPIPQTQSLLQVSHQNDHNNNNSNINRMIQSAKSPSNKQNEDQKETQQEKQSQKIKLIDSAIYLIGDTRFILMFDYKNSQWQQIYFDKDSQYQGDLKFASICQLNIKRKEFIMTGGCHKITKEASSLCYKFTIPQMRVFKQISNMKQPRYGHASVFINQLVLVMGGFKHRDDEAQAPSTLNSCEKYSVKENEWTIIAPMNQERAYFSAVRVKEEFIYVFGGFLNYETTNSIEYYNIMLDKWTLVSFIMPIKLAKYGLAKIEENQIVIAGGLLVDNAGSTRSSSDIANGGGNSQVSSYSQVNTVYKFDCNTLKWTKLAKLNFRRSMYSNIPVKENMQIFAIGGTIEGTNEVYDIRKKKWNACQSYTNIMGQNDLQTYAICSMNKHLDD